MEINQEVHRRKEILIRFVQRPGLEIRECTRRRLAAALQQTRGSVAARLGRCNCGSVFVGRATVLVCVFRWGVGLEGWWWG